MNKIITLLIMSLCLTINASNNNPQDDSITKILQAEQNGFIFDNEALDALAEEENIVDELSKKQRKLLKKELIALQNSLSSQENKLLKKNLDENEKITLLEAFPNIDQHILKHDELKQCLYLQAELQQLHANKSCACFIPVRKPSILFVNLPCDDYTSHEASTQSNSHTQTPFSDIDQLDNALDDLIDVYEMQHDENFSQSSSVSPKKRSHDTIDTTTSDSSISQLPSTEKLS